MEGVECHLCRGLTDGLASNDTDSLTGLYERTQILEVEHLFKALLEDLALRVLLLVL
jgi:hypothetical protein